MMHLAGALGLNASLMHFADSKRQTMTPNIPQAVRELITEYRRFLRTSYRFLDEKLRSQFEEHLNKTDVIVRGPYVTLARESAFRNPVGCWRILSDAAARRTARRGM
jgi:hypothetical protein